MLAVKHIQLSGHEEIYLAERVSYQPEYIPINTAGVKSRPCIWVHQYDIPAQQIDGGTVFVMNELGKTVSRYDLGPSMVSVDVKEAA